MIVGYNLLHVYFTGSDNLRSLRNEYIYDTTGLGFDQIKAITRQARWFENSISLVSTIAVIAIIISLFEPAFEKSLPTQAEKNRLLTLLREHSHPVSYFALMPDKSLWFDDNESHAIAYKKIGKYVLVLGEPIGGSNILGTAWQFQEHTAKLGVETVWYNMTGADLATSLALTAIKIGEDAIIHPIDFTLSGPALKDVRNAVSHTQKLGLQYVWHNMASISYPELKSLNDLYDAWTLGKRVSAITYSLGFFPFPTIPEGLILLVKNQAGSCLAALSFFPYASLSGYCLDLMLRADSAPSGVMESALVEAINHFKTIGVFEFNLGMAPLSNIEFMGGNKFTSSIRNLLMSQFNKFYQYKSLALFKGKFNPIWQPKYIYLKSGSTLPSVLLALAAAHRK